MTHKFLTPRPNPKLLSIVIPFCNEEEVLPKLRLSLVPMKKGHLTVVAQVPTQMGARNATASKDGTFFLAYGRPNALERPGRAVLMQLGSV